LSHNERKFDTMLTAALVRQPEIAIPAGFAACIAAGMPRRESLPPVRVTHYGRTIATLCTLLLIAALVLVPMLHPHLGGSHWDRSSSTFLRNGAFLLEMLLALMLAALFAASEIWQLG
jgi:hypothetical protein